MYRARSGRFDARASLISDMAGDGLVAVEDDDDFDGDGPDANHAGSNRKPWHAGRGERPSAAKASQREASFVPATLWFGDALRSADAAPTKPAPRNLNAGRGNPKPCAIPRGSEGEYDGRRAQSGHSSIFVPIALPGHPSKLAPRTEARSLSSVGLPCCWGPPGGSEPLEPDPAVLEA